jgi:hypothetical protein
MMRLLAHAYTGYELTAIRRKLMTNIIERLDANTERVYEVAEATLATVIMLGLIYCVISLA